MWCNSISGLLGYSTSDLQAQDSLVYLFPPDALLLHAQARLLFCGYELHEGVALVGVRLKHPQYPLTCSVKTPVLLAFLLTDCN